MKDGMGDYRWVLAIIALCIVALPTRRLSAEDDGIPSKTLQIGVSEIQPFAMKDAEGHWEGIGIDLWREVADNMGVDFELREYDSIAAMKDAFTHGEIDLSPTVPVTLEREGMVDFSVSYYRTGSAIAVPANQAGQGWLRVVERFFSAQFLAAMGLLVLLWLMAGAAMWLFERRRNGDMFGGGAVKGVGHGIWWAAVTMTTVGYGDKAPKTLGGRIVGVIWMFAAIILISSFTATIASTLTVSGLDGKVRGPRDLPSVRVGTVAQSSAQVYLERRGIRGVSSLDDAEDGLQALVHDKIDALVF
ncbi:MAG: transporter substrate-binding domain-containing protein, partial [Polyangiales bacterium]